MPVYEYVCENCEKITEELQKFSDAPLTDCTACGAQGKLRKLISRSSFALKGTGWYTTDYKRAAAPATSPAVGAENKTDAKPAGDAAATPATPAKTETKPGSKPDSA